MAQTYKQDGNRFTDAETGELIVEYSAKHYTPDSAARSFAVNFPAYQSRQVFEPALSDA